MDGTGSYLMVEARAISRAYGYLAANPGSPGRGPSRAAAVAAHAGRGRPGAASVGSVQMHRPRSNIGPPRPHSGGSSIIGPMIIDHPIRAVIDHRSILSNDIPVMTYLTNYL